MITLFTFPGFGAPNATTYEISEQMDSNPSLTLAQRNVSGGFEVNVAKRLREQDGANWTIYGIDALFGPDIIPMKTQSIGRSIARFGGALQKTPGPIALCGLSHGAWCVDTIWEEFRDPAGLFHSRLSDLKAVVTFGSPRRPFGFTTDLPGTINPAGAGVADFPHEQSYGTVPGLIAEPPEFMRSYCMINDCASDFPLTSTTRQAGAALAEFVWDGDFQSGVGLVAQLGNVISDFGSTLVELLTNPAVLAQSAFGFSRWIPLTPFNQNIDRRLGNPHGKYNSYAYDAIIDVPQISNLQYVDEWNASTNTPALSDSSGTAGHVYQVSTGGTRNLGSGNITFAVNDYIVHTNGAWQKATRNVTGGTAAWSPAETLLSSPWGGRTAVDLAVDFLKPIGAEYADVQVAGTEIPRLGYTWWQTPPD